MRYMWRTYNSRIHPLHSSSCLLRAFIETEAVSLLICRLSRGTGPLGLRQYTVLACSRTRCLCASPHVRISICCVSHGVLCGFHCLRRCLAETLSRSPDPCVSCGNLISRFSRLFQLAPAAKSVVPMHLVAVGRVRPLLRLL